MLIQKKLLEELGVFHTRTNVYTPQQNGRIEREMHTVVETARSAIHAQGLNENLWAEAITHTAHKVEDMLMRRCNVSCRCADVFSTSNLCWFFNIDCKILLQR